MSQVKVTNKILKNPLMPSNAVACLKAFLNAGYKTTFDIDSFEGVATRKGIDTGFCIGGENLYLKPDTYSKCAPDESVAALTVFLDVMDNYC